MDLYKADYCKDDQRPEHQGTLQIPTYRLHDALSRICRRCWIWHSRYSLDDLAIPNIHLFLMVALRSTRSAPLRLEPPVKVAEIVERSAVVGPYVVKSHGKCCMRIDSLQVLKLAALRSVPDTETPAQCMRVNLLFASDSIAIPTTEPLIDSGAVAWKYLCFRLNLLAFDVGQQPQGQVGVKGQYLELATLAPNSDRVFAVYAYVVGLDWIDVDRSEIEGFAYSQSHVPDGREKEFVDLFGFLRYNFLESLIRDVVSVHLFRHVRGAGSVEGSIPLPVQIWGQRQTR